MTDKTPRPRAPSFDANPQEIGERLREIQKEEGREPKKTEPTELQKTPHWGYV